MSVSVTAGSATVHREASTCTFLPMLDSIFPSYKILLIHRSRGWRKQLMNRSTEESEKKIRQNETWLSKLGFTADNWWSSEPLGSAAIVSGSFLNICCSILISKTHNTHVLLKSKDNLINCHVSSNMAVVDFTPSPSWCSSLNQPLWHVWVLTIYWNMSCSFFWCSGTNLSQCDTERLWAHKAPSRAWWTRILNANTGGHWEGGGSSMSESRRCHSPLLCKRINHRK